MPGFHCLCQPNEGGADISSIRCRDNMCGSTVRENPSLMQDNDVILLAGVKMGFFEG